MSGTPLTRRQVVAMLGGAGAGALLAPGKALADDPPPAAAGSDLAPPPSGLVSVAAKQIVRLSAVWHVPTPLEIEEPDWILQLIDRNGNVVADVKQEPAPGPNRARFLDLPYGGKSPLHLYGLVRYQPGYRIGATMELIDATTGEHVGIEQPDWFPDPSLGETGPQGEPDYRAPGAVGITKKRMLRFTIVNHAHGPNATTTPRCIAEIVDARSGQVLQSWFREDLAPGTGEVFTFAPAAGNSIAERLDVFARLRVAPGHPETGATVQIVDGNSGWVRGDFEPCWYPDPQLAA